MQWKQQRVILHNTSHVTWITLLHKATRHVDDESKHARPVAWTRRWANTCTLHKAEQSSWTFMDSIPEERVAAHGKFSLGSRDAPWGGGRRSTVADITGGQFAINSFVYVTAFWGTVMFRGRFTWLTMTGAGHGFYAARHIQYWTFLFSASVRNTL